MKEKQPAVEFDKNVHGELLKELIESASDNLLTIEGYQTLNKDIKARAKAELGVDGKMFGKLLSIRHREIRESFESENEEVIDLYDTVFP